MKTKRNLKKGDRRIDAGSELWVSWQKRRKEKDADLYHPHTKMKWSPQICLQKEEGINVHLAPTVWQTLSMYYFIHLSNSVEWMLVSKI